LCVKLFVSAVAQYANVLAVGRLRPYAKLHCLKPLKLVTAVLLLRACYGYSWVND